MTAFLGLTVLRFLCCNKNVNNDRGREVYSPHVLTFPPGSGFALPRCLAGVERGVDTGVDTTQGNKQTMEIITLILVHVAANRGVKYDPCMKCDS